MTDFKNRVVLITGAASGIGRECARQLSALGAKIGGIDLQAEGLATLPAELAGRPCATAVASVTDRLALNAAVAELEAKLGPTDLLIAAAGIGRETSAMNADHAAETVAVLEINLIGVANSFYAVLPGMVERKRGHLVALSSQASFMGLPRMGAYSASKAGLNALCDAFRIELRSHQVAVTTICPGFIRTAMTEHLTIPLMDLPDAVRRMVAAIIARKAFVTFPASGAWRLRFFSWLPRSWSDWLIDRATRRIQKKEPE